MDTDDGKTAAQDPPGLCHLPRQDPPRAANHDHDIVAGEPGDRKLSRRDWEGGVGEGPARAPRRRRTSARCHPGALDRKSTRLNSSHTVISYAVFCLKKKNKINIHPDSTDY